jgi:hypothetical protein
MIHVNGKDDGKIFASVKGLGLKGE